jgi:hypothetical protein
MKEMIMRHNMIQDLLVEVIKKHRSIKENEILVNKTSDSTQFKETRVIKLLKEEAL